LALKKKHFAEGEIAIFDEACIYKRGEYWQFRMWLPKENKYARKSLRIRSEATSIEKGKAAYLEIYANLQQGKSYFSIITKEGVEKYISFRLRDVELGHIVKGRHTHCSCSKDKDSHAETAATDDTKRHRTNRLHTYPSTTNVTKSTIQQRKTLKTRQKCTV
jgi:hypothetical protein